LTIPLSDRLIYGYSTVSPEDVIAAALVLEQVTKDLDDAQYEACANEELAEEALAAVEALKTSLKFVRDTRVAISGHLATINSLVKTVRNDPTLEQALDDIERAIDEALRQCYREEDDEE